ncbi:MAG: YtxH domain-containing protein [Acidobacteria bacterium]|nr:YtxH domain-containing protein [Acidobacteriota bacterium]
MTAKGYWIAFGVGVAAGAAVALLYAPQRGMRTRRQLMKGIGGAGDYLTHAGDYLKDQAERLAREAQSAYRKGIDQASEYLGSARKYASETAEFAEVVSKIPSKIM